MAKIILIRHGEDDNTVRGGWSNTALTENGISQSEKLADRLISEKINIDEIYTSDLLRAYQTADIIAEKYGINPIKCMELREVNNGRLAGMKNEIADVKYPNLYWRCLEWEEHYPDGESPKEFFERIKKLWNRFSNKYKDSDKSIAIVTHAGVINIILSIISNENYSNKNKPKSVPNASATMLKFKNDMWNLSSYNEDKNE